MAQKARDIMTPDPECIQASETLDKAAQRMRDLDVGAMPICGDDGKLQGMITDRDIVVHCIADGKNPSETQAGDLQQREAVTIGADDSLEEAMETMANHQVRRLPVIDGTDLVGIVAQADLARALGEGRFEKTIEEISRSSK